MIWEADSVLTGSGRIACRLFWNRFLQRWISPGTAFLRLRTENGRAPSSFWLETGWNSEKHFGFLSLELGRCIVSLLIFSYTEF
jgi:hypothetical protein